MARRVWVVSPPGSADSSERRAAGAPAKLTEGSPASTRRRFSRLRTNTKNDDGAASASATTTSPLDEGGMAAAPDRPR